MSYIEEQKDSFIYHLEALRSTLIKCFVAVSVLFIPCYLITPHFISILISWCCPPEIGTLKYFAPMEVFITRLKLALALSILVSFPYCVWAIWRFLLPALYDSEKKALKWWVIASYFLFLIGALFCALLILPMLMRFAASFADTTISPQIGLANFLNLSGRLIVIFGIMFQFPLAVMLAVRFDLVSVNFLRAKRPYIIISILILAGLATPPDVISQIMLALPTWFLFELGIILAARFENKSTASSYFEQNDTKINVEVEKNNSNLDVESVERNKKNCDSTNDDAMLDFYINQENKESE